MGSALDFGHNMACYNFVFWLNVQSQGLTPIFLDLKN
jgi:hypothetical protein